jgi:hypothetical protein
MASIDIDINDILWGMMDYEKQQLVDDLYDDGYVAKKDPRYDLDEDGNFGDFDAQVTKLLGNSWRLSKEDEETILKITNKII